MHCKYMDFRKNKTSSGFLRNKSFRKFSEITMENIFFLFIEITKLFRTIIGIGNDSRLCFPFL